MTLKDIIAVMGPVGQDWLEYSHGLAVVPTSHPPSIKNPIPVKQDYAQDGFRKGDSAAARKKAKEDLLMLHSWMRRQIGKPEIAQGAPTPLFPDSTKWI